MIYECDTEDGSGFFVVAATITDAARIAESHIAARSSEVVSITKIPGRE